MTEVDSPPAEETLEAEMAKDAAPEGETAPAAAEPGTGMIARPGGAASSLRRIEETFTEDEKTQIAAYLGIEAANPVFVPYLATCAQYGLDPVMGQIWLIPLEEKAKDGEPAKTVYKPAVGRDGFLAIARRTPEYEGMEFDVVCARDTFEKKTVGGIPHVLHEYPPLPKEGEEIIPAKYRGDIIGAYCIVYVQGQKPTYYFAWLKEHAKVGTNSGTGESYYKSAWKYTSAMILKSAQSVALRLALGITGIVGADELKPESTSPELEGEAGAVQSPAEYLADLQIPDDLRTALQTKVATANEEAPNSWSLAKLKMRLESRGETGARQVIDEIDREMETRSKLAEEAKAAEEAILVEKAQDLQTPFLLHLTEEGRDDWIRITELVIDEQAGAVTMVDEGNTSREYDLGTEFEIRKLDQ